MKQAVIDGRILEYEVSGRGEPVVLIHGSFIADTFRPLLSESTLARREYPNQLSPTGLFGE